MRSKDKPYGSGSAYEDGYDFVTEELTEQMKDTTKSEMEKKKTAVAVAEHRCMNKWGHENPNSLLNSNVFSCFKGIRDKVGIPISNKFKYPSSILEEMEKDKQKKTE